MCGRFTNMITWADLQALYQLSLEGPPPDNRPPRGNISPTQDVDFVHLDQGGARTLDRGRWWLVPFWAKELPKATLFNARIETIDTTPAFRDAFKSRRCLIPADGYFEWTKGEDGGKDPWLLQLPEGKPFSFAGLWAHNDNLGVTSCTIVTAPAAPHIAHIHTRMPVILEAESYAAWLDPAESPGPAAKALLLDHHLDDQLQFHRVSRAVNNSRYDGTDTKRPIVNPA